MATLEESRGGGGRIKPLQKLLACFLHQVTGTKVKGEICVENEKEQGGGVWEGVEEVLGRLASCLAARLRRQPLSRPPSFFPQDARWGRDGCAGGAEPRAENPAPLLLKNVASFSFRSQHGGVESGEWVGGGQQSGSGLCAGRGGWEEEPKE